MSRRLLNATPLKSSPASPNRGGFRAREDNPSGRYLEEALRGGIAIGIKAEDIHVYGAG